MEEWDMELDERALAEIERLEQEALRREQLPKALAPSPPKPAPKQLSASSFVPCPSRSVSSSAPLSRVMPPAAAAPASAYFRPPPSAQSAHSAIAAAIHTEQLDDIDEPEPGNASVLPASSSSPSRYNVPTPAPRLPAAVLPPQGPARKIYSGSQTTQSTAPGRIPLMVDLALQSRDRISLRIMGNGWNAAVLSAAQSVTGSRAEKDKSVTFPIEAYHTVVDSLRRLPDLQLRLLWPPVYDIYISKKEVNQSKHAELRTLLPPKLNEILLPFQRLGVEFALKREGRVLIGDEMGLGKTMQAVAIAACYRADWPLVVFTPASVTLQWAEHFEKYIPGIREDEVNIVMSGKGNLNGLINIVSYNLAQKLKEQFSQKEFKVIICDESHFLKNYSSKRTETIVPLIQASRRARRAILLSGTPAISRPKELWQQISALDTPLFGSPKQPWSFYDRYCAAYRDRFNKLNTDGASNLSELHLFLQDTVMIRRLKADVLTQLPPKRRTEVKVEIAKKFKDALKKIENEKSKLKMELEFLEMSDKEALIDNMVESKGTLMELFKETGTAKIPAIVEYVSDLCEGDEKFLVFAYHQDVMDSIEHQLNKQNVEFIRIDGHTPTAHRAQLVQNFQENPNVRVAILSITAAGIGLTLHAASAVVFAELYWNPGQLNQAEDRAHRIGQTASSVNIYYLIAKGTFDERIWDLIKRKLAVIGSTLNGAAETIGIDRTEKKVASEAVTDPFLLLKMEETETYRERHEEFLKRRQNRKAAKEFIKTGIHPDEAIEVADGDEDFANYDLAAIDPPSSPASTSLKRPAPAPVPAPVVATPTTPVATRLHTFAVVRRPGQSSTSTISSSGNAFTGSTVSATQSVTAAPASQSSLAPSSSAPDPSAATASSQTQRAAYLSAQPKPSSTSPVTPSLPAGQTPADFVASLARTFKRPSAALSTASAPTNSTSSAVVATSVQASAAVTVPAAVAPNVEKTGEEPIIVRPKRNRFIADDE